MTEPKQWLVVGHGSVGSFIAERLVSQGMRVAVLDPAPRVPIGDPLRIADLERLRGRVDYVVSCVPPDVAGEVPALVDGALRPDGMVFEWNSISPADKRSIRDAVPASTIDVALLDSLDAAGERPNLAVSGTDAETAAALLTEQGFQVEVVGDDVGQAASIKYLRSVFMKGLEALALEYVVLAYAVDDRGVVRDSLAGNLGQEFVAFMDVLVATNRLHAERRGHELAEAARTFGEDGISLRMAGAAVDVLQRAADAWAAPDAPPPGAPTEDLVSYLQRMLWTSSAST
jgi:3-hydroxyisobutyrate dehydrogenase-like beta-hydroxyacid dehydrogenase